MDYILWGISWANLRLMMADALRTDYKGREQAPNGTAGSDGVIDLTDPHADIRSFNRMFGGQ